MDANVLKLRITKSKQDSEDTPELVIAIYYTVKSLI